MELEGVTGVIDMTMMRMFRAAQLSMIYISRRGSSFRKQLQGCASRKQLQFSSRSKVEAG